MSDTAQSIAEDIKSDDKGDQGSSHKDDKSQGSDGVKGEAPEVQKAKQGDELSEEEIKKLELRIASIIEHGLDKIQPILKLITDNCTEAEEKQRRDELDEEAFVKTMKPLLEQGGSILQSILDQVKALDPDQKIQNIAKRKTEDSEASPEQQKIAKGLAELTSNVTKTIEDAKKKIANMPHAKRELGPLFNLLSQPLFQILSAVGLLVAGVLNLVGNILDALGLGGVVRGIIDGLGLRNILGLFGWKIQLTKTDK